MYEWMNYHNSTTHVNTQCPRHRQRLYKLNLVVHHKIIFFQLTNTTDRQVSYIPPHAGYWQYSLAFNSVYTVNKQVYTVVLLITKTFLFIYFFT